MAAPALLAEIPSPAVEATPVVADPEPFLDTDELTFEVVDGRLVEVPKMGVSASFVASNLIGELHAHLKRDRVGRLVVENLFRIPVEGDARRKRRPDVAFVSFERWPADRPWALETTVWDVIPDLAIEIVSPTDEAERLYDKVQEYVRVGVRLVWVVYPNHGHVHVYEAATAVRILTAADVLDGGTALPGLRLPLAEVFAGLAPAPGSGAAP